MVFNVVFNEIYHNIDIETYIFKTKVKYLKEVEIAEIKRVSKKFTMFKY